MNNDQTISQSENINSPEELNNYLHVTNPSMWFVLVAVLVMLVGLVVGSFVYNIESKIYFDVKVENGTAYLLNSDKLEYKEHMKFFIETDEGDKEYAEEIEQVLEKEEIEEYSAIAYVSKNIPDGEYFAFIVKREPPISYLFK